MVTNTRSSRLWTLLLLGLEVLLLRSEKNATLTVFIEIHKGTTFDSLTIKLVYFINTKLYFKSCSNEVCQHSQVRNQNKDIKTSFNLEKIL
jgi:hypothetical protein